MKRNIDQTLRSRNFDARNEMIETGAVVKNRTDLSGVERGPEECYQLKAKGQCSKKKKGSVPSRQTDRFHDLRLLPGCWRSRYRS